MLGSSLKPFMYRRLGRENYKKAILEIKLNALIQGYQASKDALEKPEEDALRIVLKRGAELMLKNLASYHISGIVISDELMTKARATAEHLLDELESIEKRLTALRKETTVPNPTPVRPKG